MPRSCARSTVAGRLKPILARRALPSDLLADALDRDAPTAAADWLVAPLVPRVPAEGLLVAHLADAKSFAKTAKNGAAHAPALESLDALAAALAAGLSSARSRHRQRRRIDRLETILTLAAQWGQTLEMQPLLNRMAEEATRLLGADRASIFLWDRQNQTLVGRPALGVPGGELRIPDSAGVVGQVVQTGEPRRVAQATSVNSNRSTAPLTPSLAIRRGRFSACRCAPPTARSSARSS